MEKEALAILKMKAVKREIKKKFHSKISKELF